MPYVLHSRLRAAAGTVSEGGYNHWPRRRLALAPGAGLGPYDITNVLGAGGMSGVYRARDTRLDRAVAIKDLPETFAVDPDRLSRSEPEALAGAALSHPGIRTIHALSNLYVGEGLRVQ